MHDIKYFILNKNNQTIQGGGTKFFFQERGKLPKNTIFQNPDGGCPLILFGSAPDYTGLFDKHGIEKKM
jgi:hypothetical protein